MNRLFSCAACQRYILESERHCPFCGEAAVAAAASSAAASPRPRSRAAVFAMRTALVAGIAPALACGGTSDAQRQRPQDVAGSGGSSASGAGGSETTMAMNGNGGTVSSGANGGSAGDNGDVDPDPPAARDAGDGGFAPVPIYGGVFPDPLARVRV